MLAVSRFVSVAWPLRVLCESFVLFVTTTQEHEVRNEPQRTQRLQADENYPTL
jgi:hypothetical protein